jgi:hypothetical protein
MLNHGAYIASEKQSIDEAIESYRVVSTATISLS